jgi:hypothetical protein
MRQPLGVHLVSVHLVSVHLVSVCLVSVNIYLVSGQPLSLAVKNALSPGTTASCL